MQHPHPANTPSAGWTTICNNSQQQPFPLASSNLLPLGQKPPWTGMPQTGVGGPPDRFPEAVFCKGRRESTPFQSHLGQRSFMLVSEATGRRWHAVNSVRVCGFGEVFRAVELVAHSSGMWRHEHSYVAIKVRFLAPC